MSLQPPTLLHIHTLAVICCLLYAMAADLHSRRITNRAWIIMAAILLVPRILLAITNPTPILPTLAWGIGITVMAYLFWITATWAGADAKGTMVLAWMIPILHTGTAWIHPLLISAPLSLGMVLMWQRFRPGALPFFAFYTPTTILVLVIFWIR